MLSEVHCLVVGVPPALACNVDVVVGALPGGRGFGKLLYFAWLGIAGTGTVVVSCLDVESIAKILDRVSNCRFGGAPFGFDSLSNLRGAFGGAVGVGCLIAKLLLGMVE